MENIFPYFKQTSKIYQIKESFVVFVVVVDKSKHKCGLFTKHSINASFYNNLSS
jgi:hypothetical protein